MQDEYGDNGTERLVPWTVGEVFIALFLVFAFWPSVAVYILQRSGFYLHFYGPDLIDPEGVPLKSLASDVHQIVTIRLYLWATMLAFPFQVITIPFVLNSMSGTRPERLGLTTRDLIRNLWAAAKLALVLIPLVYGLNWLVTQLFLLWNQESVIKHEITRLAQTHQLQPIEWALLVIAPLVIAPIKEELIFRGLLLRWFVDVPWASHLGMVASLFFALSLRQEAFHTAWEHRAPAEVLQAAAPALFVLALIPVYALVWRRSRSSAGPALVASSLAFAALHSSVWPTPIALFVLALGLGLLALRYGSLVSPITLHALFNGTSCVLLFLFPGGAGP